MNRRAFTLLELLVVIAIIAILGGLVFYAMSSMGTKGRHENTRVRMENLKSIFAEYEMKTRLATPPAQWYFGNTFGQHDTQPGAFWQRVSAAAAPLVVPDGPVSTRDSNSARYTSDAVRNSAIAVYEFRRIPSAADAMDKLPPSAFMVEPPFTMQNGSPMLDGWDNPIIYVPGTAGLWMDRDSDGNVDVGERVVAPNNRPFFVSAGPDGIFFVPERPETADDNIYSFEQ